MFSAWASPEEALFSPVSAVETVLIAWFKVEREVFIAVTPESIADWDKPEFPGLRLFTIAERSVKKLFIVARYPSAFEMSLAALPIFTVPVVLASFSQLFSAVEICKRSLFMARAIVFDSVRIFMVGLAVCGL